MSKEFNDSYKDYELIEKVVELVNDLNKKPEYTRLTLVGCNLTNESIAALAELKYVKELILDHNNIDEAALDLVNLQHFDKISINNNSISPSVHQKLLKKRLESTSSASPIIKCERGGFNHSTLWPQPRNREHAEKETASLSPLSVVAGGSA